MAGSFYIFRLGEMCRGQWLVWSLISSQWQKNDWEHNPFCSFPLLLQEEGLFLLCVMQGSQESPWLTVWPTVTFSPISSVFGFSLGLPAGRCKNHPESLLVPTCSGCTLSSVVGSTSWSGLLAKANVSPVLGGLAFRSWLAGSAHSPSLSVHPPLPSWQTRKSLVRGLALGQWRFANIFWNYMFLRKCLMIDSIEELNYKLPCCL